MGLVLGSVLFFLSEFLYVNVANLTRYGGAARMFKRFKALERTGKSWQRFLDDLRDAEADTRHGIEQLKPQVDAVAGRSQEAAKFLAERFRLEVTAPPEWVKASLRSLSDDEARSLFAETHLYVLVVCLSLLVTFALGTHALTLGLANLPIWVSACAALGVAIVPLVIGQLWGQAEREQRGRDQENRSARRQWYWGAPVACLALAWLLLVFRVFPDPAVSWPLAFAIAPALALLFCQRRNAMLPGFLRPVLTSWAYSVNAFCRHIHLGLIGAVALAFELLTLAFKIVARPFEWVLSFRRKSVPEALA